MEEDGRLTEQILHEYMGMNFSNAPRVWQSSTAADALTMLSRQDFDLIVGPNGWHVSQFSTEQVEAGIPDNLIQYEPIHSLTKITPYGSRRTPLQ